MDSKLTPAVTDTLSYLGTLFRHQDCERQNVKDYS